MQRITQHPKCFALIALNILSLVTDNFVRGDKRMNMRMMNGTNDDGQALWCLIDSVRCCLHQRGC